MARSLYVIALGLLLFLPDRATAQDTPPAEATPAEATPETTPVVEADPPRTGEDEARARFRQGLVLARGGDCGAAIAEFEASYSLMPRPNTLFNMAQCEERLHRYDLAVQQYEQYLEIAPADAEDRDTVMATLESLRGLLGTIHIEVNVPSDVWLGDRIVGVAPGDVLVPGGGHAIELRATGYLPERREIAVAAHQRVELSITLTTAETTVIEETTIEETHLHEVTIERPPVPVAVFATAVTLTALTAIGGAAAGINALMLHDQALARDTRLPADTGAIQASALAADVLYGTAGVLAISTIVLGVLTDFGGATPEEESDEEEAASASLTVAPLLSDTTAGLFVGGSF